MNNKNSLETLHRDVENIFDISEMVKLYEKLIIKNSYVNGKFDEDCKAYIETRLITAIINFKI